MMSRVSLPILYKTKVVGGGSLNLTGKYFAGAFRYRIGIGFVGIIVQHLIVYGMDPIPTLYQNAPLKVVLF